MSIILYLFYSVLALATFRLFLRLCLSLSYNLKRKRVKVDRFPKISIIVPSYNEEKTIKDCIRALMSLDYPNYEIIVVDDGSTDRTFEETNQFGEVKVIRQQNMGKSNALNNGIQASNGEIIVTVDADTKIDEKSLRRIAERFGTNDKLGAVAGNVKVDPTPGLLNIVQSAEYTLGINLVRKAQSVLGCVMVVPGPIAALRKETIESANYFSDDTFAEDFDITVKILKKDFKIEYEDNAIAYTDAPKNMEDLIKQRRRWYRGMIQVLSKHQDMYMNKKHGFAGTFGIPNLWFDVSSPFINISLVLVTLLTWLLTGEFLFSLIGLVIYLTTDLFIGILAISLDPKSRRKEYLALPLLLFYNTFLDGIRIMSLTEEMVSIVMEWEKPKR